MLKWKPPTQKSDIYRKQTLCLKGNHHHKQRTYTENRHYVKRETTNTNNGHKQKTDTMLKGKPPTQTTNIYRKHTLC